MKRLDFNLKILVGIIILLALSCNLMAQPLQGRVRQPGQLARLAQTVPGLTEEQRIQNPDLAIESFRHIDFQRRSRMYPQRNRF